MPHELVYGVRKFYTLHGRARQQSAEDPVSAAMTSTCHWRDRDAQTAPQLKAEKTERLTNTKHTIRTAYKLSEHTHTHRDTRALQDALLTLTLTPYPG